MGLGKFWFRFLSIILSLIVIWELTKSWNIFYTKMSNGQEIQINQNDDETLKIKGSQIEKVFITVYYEALCPDSRGFVLRQLMPTYQKIQNKVVIEMVPYGKATTTGLPNGYKFSCQHGPRECEANMIHACAIDHIKNPTVQLSFLACMIEHNIWPINITRSCAEKMHLNAESILNCTKSSRGPELLAKYGKLTNALSPPVSFIPTITLNGDIDDQTAILANLLGEVCKHFRMLPDGCQ